MALVRSSSGFNSSRLSNNGITNSEKLFKRLKRLERLEPRLRSRNRKIMRPLPQPTPAIVGHDNGIAPLTNILAIRRDRRWLANENHILTHRHRQLARTLGMRRDDRPVISLAAAMHVE